MKKISIKEWSQEHAIVSIQENEKGVFGPAKEVYLDKEEIENLSFKEIIETIINNPDQEKIQKNSQGFSPVVVPWGWSNPILLSFLQKTMNIKQKAIVASIFGVFLLIIVSVLFMEERVAKKDLEQQIKDIRADREKEYDSCIDLCDSWRKPYDAQVNHLKKKLERVK